MWSNTIAVGRLTRDPETKTYGERSVTRFTVAVDDGYGDNKTTDFYRCAAWNKKGQSVQQYTQKGSLVLVEGRFKSSKKEDREYWELRCDEVKFLSSNNNAQVNGTQQEQVNQFNQQYAQQQGQQQFPQGQPQFNQGQQFVQQPNYVDPQQPQFVQHAQGNQFANSPFGGMDFNNVPKDDLPF